MIRIEPNINQAGLKEIVEHRLNVFNRDRQFSGTGVRFSENLKEAVVKEQSKDIFQLIARLEEAGKNFVTEPTIKYLNVYKESVKDFIMFATRKSYRVKEVFNGRLTKHRIVETVDEELEKLTVDVLSGEMDRINLMDKVDTIKGLLVNLVY